MFILISELNVAQVTFLQTLLASGTEDFLKTNHLCTETLWLTPRGVPRWGHATACTTRCPWKTSNYFQHFKASKTRTPSWRRSIYPWEGFSTKDIQLGACHHFLKQVCWQREAQPRPWCRSAYQALAKHSTEAWGAGTSVHPDATCTSLGTLDPLPLRWAQPGFNLSYPLQFSGCSGVYLFCIFTSLLLSLQLYFSSFKLTKTIFDSPYPLPNKSIYLFSRFSRGRLKRFNFFHEHWAVSPITWSFSKSNQWWGLMVLTTELMLKCLKWSLFLVTHHSYKSHQLAPWRHPHMKVKTLLHNNFPTQTKTPVSSC